LRLCVSARDPKPESARLNKPPAFTRIFQKFLKQIVIPVSQKNPPARKTHSQSYQRANPMIEVVNISKHFGTKIAVDNLSFTVQKGEVLGFLGPNGAGKSTTMRMVTGFLPASSGDAKICGISITENPFEAKTKIGYLPESAPLYNDMTVIGFLKFCADVRKLSGSAKREAVEKAIETCFLNSVAHQSIDTLSKGYRHRTCLAQALLHDPEVLILDEPTDGLDPNQKYEVRQLIKRLGETKAILFSTHILEEVEAACTRAVIVDRGSIVADGTPAELIAKAPNGSLTELFRKLTTTDTAA
jgi:ABC-2 type transport system ATP-binding protein